MPAITEARTTAEQEQACALLTSVYVGEGYTQAEAAGRVFIPAVLESGGTLLVGKDAAGSVIGAVLFLHTDSPMRQLAEAGEREFRVLAVGRTARGTGMGAALVQACIQRAQATGATGLVLWSQPTMHAAHRLYERLGFVRTPQRDVPDPRGWTRLVYVHPLRP